MNIKLVVRAVFLLAICTVVKPVAAIEVTRAVIRGEQVVVAGNGVPYSLIWWQGVQVAQADAQGKFRFATNILPTKPMCIGDIMDESEELIVEVDNCRGAIDAFYLAEQGLAMVAPGQQMSVRSWCEPGDFVVSGSMVAYGSQGGPSAFTIMENGPLIDGSTGQQSWVLTGVNTSATDSTDLRVSAVCAKVLEPNPERLMCR